MRLAPSKWRQFLESIFVTMWPQATSRKARRSKKRRSVHYRTARAEALESKIVLAISPIGPFGPYTIEVGDFVEFDFDVSDDDGDPIIVSGASPNGLGGYRFRFDATASGDFPQTISATDNIDDSASTTFDIHVSPPPPPNTPPTIGSIGNQTAVVGHELTVGVSVADADGDPVTVKGATLNSQGQFSWTPTAADVGTPREFTLTPNDGTEDGTPTKFTVTVSANSVPTVTFTPNATRVSNGSTVAATATHSTDAEGDPWTWTNGVNVSDGTFTSGPLTTPGANTFTAIGTDGIDVASGSFTVYVNSAPTFSVQDYTIHVGQSVNFTVSASDADNDMVSYSGALASDGSFNYTATAVGSYSFTATASDDLDSTSHTFTITVTPNLPPAITGFSNRTVHVGSTVTMYGSATDDENDPITWGGDADSNGKFEVVTSAADLARGSTEYDVTAFDGRNTVHAPFTITVTNAAPVISGFSNQTITLGEQVTQSGTATDADADPLTWSGDVDGNGVFSWTPTATGTFEKRAQSWDGYTTSTTFFTITVNSPPVNNAPTISNILDQTKNENGDVEIQFTASDPDGDSIVTSLSVAGETLNNATISPVDGQPGLYVLHWTPGEAYDRPQAYSFTISVSDGTLSASDSFDLTIQEVATAPQLTFSPDDSGSWGVSEGGTFTTTFTGVDPDIVGGVAQTLTFSLVDAPVGATIDPVTRLISWPVPANFGAQTVSFYVYIWDGDVAHSDVHRTVTVAVTAVNSAPTWLPNTTLVFPAIDEDATPSPTSATVVREGLSVHDLLTQNLGQSVISDLDADDGSGIAIVGATSQGVWEYSLNGGVSWITLNDLAESHAFLLPDNGEQSRVRFIPHANVNTSVGQPLVDALTLRAWDRTQGTAGSYVAISATGNSTAFSATTTGLRLQINPINDPPQVVVPATQLIDPAGTLTFAIANNNTLQVQDVDAGTAELLASLTVDDGIMHAEPNTGLTITGNNTRHLTLRGTRVAINAALNGLLYTPPANLTTATLTLSVDDQGATGGGHLVDTKSVVIMAAGAFAYAEGVLTISGTASNDNLAIEFTGQNDFEVRLNGLRRTYHTDIVHNVSINLNGGSDRAELRPWQGNFQVSLSTRHVKITENRYDDPNMPFEIIVDGGEDVTVYGSDSDTANFLNDADHAEQYLGKPGEGLRRLADDPSVVNRAIGFGEIFAWADTSDATVDTAELTDTSAKEWFYGLPEYSLIAILGSDNKWQKLNEVIGFTQVTGTSTAGGGDWALLYDSTSSDTFAADGGLKSASMSNAAGTYLSVNGFVHTYGYAFQGAPVGEEDVANIMGDTNVAETFTGAPFYSLMQSSQWRAYVTMFDVVDARGSASDSANLYYTIGANTSGWLRVTADNELYEFSATGFGNVGAFELAAEPPQVDTSRSPHLDATYPLATNSLGTSIIDLVHSDGSSLIHTSRGLPGIALIGVDSTYGRWEYTLSHGHATATMPTGWAPVGNVSATSALLLAANYGTRLRFIANAGVERTVDQAIAFRAWDQLLHRNGERVDPATILTSVSVADDTASIEVAPESGRILVSDVTIHEDQMNTYGLVATVAGGNHEIQYLRVDQIQGGNLFLHDGLTPLYSGAFITPLQGAAGLRFQPAYNFSGTGSFLLQGARSASNDQLLETYATGYITINALNDPPSLNLGSPPIVNAHNGAVSLTHWASNITPGPDNEQSQTVTITTTVDRTDLFDVLPTITADGTLSFTPAANKTGVALVTARVQDNGNGTGEDYNATERIFPIRVYAANGRPIIPEISDPPARIEGDTEPTVIPVGTITAGVGEPDQELTVSATTNNPSLITNLTIVQDPVTLAYSVQYDAAVDQSGQAQVTVRAWDNGGSDNHGIDTTTRTFNVVVLPKANAPVIVPPSAQSTSEDTPLYFATWAGNPFSVTDADGAMSELTATISTSLGTLELMPGGDFERLVAPLPGQLQVRGTAAEVEAALNHLKFVPPENYFSSAETGSNRPAALITVDIDDSYRQFPHTPMTAHAELVVNIDSVNDAPTLAPIDEPDPLVEGAGGQHIVLSGLSTGANEDQNLTITVTTNNPDLLPDLHVEAGQIVYTPAAAARGTALVTVTVSDGGGTERGGIESVSRQFTVTVEGINRTPTISSIEPVTILEDGAVESVSFTVSAGTDEWYQGLLVSAITSDPSLVLVGVSQVYSAPGSYTISLTPRSNRSGTAQITINAIDDGGTAHGGVDRTSTTFSVTVSAVNDAPSATVTTHSVWEGSGEQRFAVNLNSGAPDEADSVTVTDVTVDSASAALFSTQPTFDAATSQFVFTPAENASGTATVTLHLQDGGGVSDGGVNTGEFTFSFAIGATNDAPTLSIHSAYAGSPVTISEDDDLSYTGIIENISFGPDDETQQAVHHWTVTTDNPTLFPNGISINSLGTVHFVPAAGKSGTAHVTVRLTDNGGTAHGGQDTSEPMEFDVQVLPVNDPPTAHVATTALGEDAPPQAWSVTLGAGAPDESDTVTVTSVTTNNSAMFDGPVYYDTVDAKLHFKPADDVSGTVQVTLHLEDDGGSDLNGISSSEVTFSVVIHAINDRPTFTVDSAYGSSTTPLLLNEDSDGVVSELFTNIDLGNLESDQIDQWLITTDNPTLFPAGSIVVQSNQQDVRFAPAANQYGTAKVTVGLKDSGGISFGGMNTSVLHEFYVQVRPVNDAPSASVATSTLQEGAGPQAWPVTLFAGGVNENDAVSVSNITTDNDSLFEELPTFNSANSTVCFKVHDDMSGTVAVTLHLSDLGGTDHGGVDTGSVAFTVVVSAVNDRPSFGLANYTSSATALVINEDRVSDEGVITDVDFGPLEAQQSIDQWTIVSDNASLFPTGSITVVGTSHVLHFAPAANQFGTAKVTMTLVDNGGTANGGVNSSLGQELYVTVLPVNDPPSAQVTYSNVTVDVGQQSFPVTLLPGGIAENDSVSVSTITTSDDTMFAVLPVYDPNLHALVFTPGSNVGTVTVSLGLEDSGNSDNGGANTSSMSFVFEMVAPTNNSGQGGEEEEPPPPTPPTITVTGGSGYEGESAMFVFTLSEVSSDTVRIDFETSSNPYYSNNGDYVTASDYVTIAPGELTTTTSISLLTDNVVEGSEYFNLIYTAFGSAATAGGTIMERPVPVIADVTVVEGMEATFLLTLTTPWNTEDLTFTYATQDGTAIAGTPGDYNRTTGSVTILKGETTASITVPTNIDAPSQPEPDEYFTLALSHTSGYLTLNPAPQATIISPIYSFAGDSVGEGGNLVFTANAGRVVPMDISFVVEVTSPSGTASLNDDYSFGGAPSPLTASITIPQGASKGILQVGTVDDAVEEPSETVILSFTGMGVSATATGTIEASDEIPPPPPPPPVLTMTLTPNDEGQESSALANVSHFNWSSGTIDWGDGDSTSVSPTSGLTGKHTYTDEGDYTVQLTIRNTAGDEVRTSSIVSIVDVVPTINLSTSIAPVNNTTRIKTVDFSIAGYKNDGIFYTINGSQHQTPTWDEAQQLFVGSFTAYFDGVNDNVYHITWGDDDDNESGQNSTAGHFNVAPVIYAPPTIGWQDFEARTIYINAGTGSADDGNNDPWSWVQQEAESEGFWRPKEEFSQSGTIPVFPQDYDEVEEGEGVEYFSVPIAAWDSWASSSTMIVYLPAEETTFTYRASAANDSYQIKLGGARNNEPEPVRVDLKLNDSFVKHTNESGLSVADKPSSWTVVQCDPSGEVSESNSEHCGELEIDNHGKGEYTPDTTKKLKADTFYYYLQRSDPATGEPIKSNVAAITFNPPNAGCDCDRVCDRGVATDNGDSLQRLLLPSGIGLNNLSSLTGAQSPIVSAGLDTSEYPDGTYTAELTYGDVEQVPVTVTKGGTLKRALLSLEGPKTLPTGRYDWEVKVYNQSNQLVDTITGQDDWVASDAALFGNGWTIAGYSQLKLDPGGLVAYWVDSDAKLVRFSRSSPAAAFTSTDDGYTKTTLHEITSAGVAGYEVRDNDRASLRFNGTGQLTEVVGSGQQVTRYQYSNTTGQLETITDPSGHQTTLGYANGKVVSLSDSPSRTVSLHRNASGQIDTVTMPSAGAGQAAAVYSYTYVNGQVATWTDPTGVKTTYTVDAAGTAGRATHLKQEVVVNGQNIVLTDRAIPILALRGMAVAGQSTAMIRASKFSTAIEPEFAYADPITETNDSSDPTRITYPDGTTERWVYEGTNGDYQYFDRSGAVTVNRFNADHQPILVQQIRGTPDSSDATYPTATDDLVTVYRYDGLKLVDEFHVAGVVDDTPTRSSNDPADQRTHYRYDSHGRQTASIVVHGQLDNDAQRSSTDPNDEVSETVYDSFDRVERTVDPLGRTVIYGYDNLGRQTRVTQVRGAHDIGTRPQNDPDDVVTTTSYDALGRVQSTTDYSGTTTYIYSYANVSGQVHNVTTVTRPDPDGAGPLGPLVTVSHQYKGNEVETIDVNGLVTLNSYENPLDNDLLTETRQVRGVDDRSPGRPASDLADLVTSYEYEEHARLDYQTDPRGISTKYLYDAAGNQTHIFTVPVGQLNNSAAWQLVSHSIYDPKTGEFLRSEVGDSTEAPVGVTPQQSTSYDTVAQTRTESYTDARGTSTTVYNALGQRELEVSGGATQAFTYDTFGRLLTQTDSRGTTSYSYGLHPVDGGHLYWNSTAVFDPAGRSTATHSDAAGQVRAQIDGYALATRFEYDDLGRQTKTIDRLNYETTTVYNNAGQVDHTVDARGYTTSYLYDGRGLRTHVIEPDPDGAGPLASPTTEFKYNAAGNLVETKDPLGRSTFNHYDDLGRLYRVTRTNPVGTGTIVLSETVYNAKGQVERTIDAAGQPTEYRYDAFGRNDRVIGPQGTTAPTFDAQNRVKSTTQTFPNGQTRTVEQFYDADGNVWKVNDGPNSVTYRFDALGRATAAVDLRGGETQTYYNVLGQVDHIVDPEGRTTAYAYDGSGLKTHEIQIVGSRDPNPSFPINDLVTRFKYNANGWLQYQIDPLGQVTEYRYDAEGRVLFSIDAMQGTTAFTYDGNGNRLRLTDPVGNSTTWTYDYAGRMLTDTNELEATRHYTYDAVGNLVTYVDRNGRTTAYEYDAWNRRTAEKWLEGTSERTTTVRETRWRYDRLNRLTHVIDPESRYAYGYNSAGQMASVDNGGTYGSPRVLLTYTYDAYGRRSQLNATIDSHRDLQNTYTFNDSAGTLVLTQGSQYGGATVPFKQVNLGTNFAGQINSLTRSVRTNSGSLATVATTSYSYDSVGRLKTLTHREGSGGNTAVIGGYTYGYDAASRITAMNSAVDGWTDYRYDATSQLLGATVGTGIEQVAPFHSSALTPDRTWVNGANATYNPSEQIGYQVNAYSYTTVVPAFDSTAATPDPAWTNDYTELFAQGPHIGYHVAAYSFTTHVDRFHTDELVANPGLWTTGYTATSTPGPLLSYWVHEYTRQDPIPGGHSELLTPDPSWPVGGYTATYSLPTKNGYHVDSFDSTATSLDATWTAGATLLTDENSEPIGYHVNAFDLPTTFDANGTPAIPPSPEWGTGYSFTYTPSVHNGYDVGPYTVPVLERAFRSYDATPSTEWTNGYDPEYGPDLPTGFWVEAYDFNTDVPAFDSTATTPSLSWTSGQTAMYGADVHAGYHVNEYSYVTQVPAFTTSSLTLSGEWLNGAQAIYSDPALTGFDVNGYSRRVGVSQSWDYTYDANGNRTMPGYVTGANNETLADGTHTYHYDGEGNRTWKISVSDSSEYLWDFKNRMTKVVNRNVAGQVTAQETITYAVDNHRIGTRVETPSGATFDVAIERYALDGDNVLFDFAGDATAAPTLVRRYFTSTTIDQIFAQEDVGDAVNGTGTTKWLLTDHLGTVRDVIKNDSSVMTHLAYDPFGMQLGGDSSLANNTFQGKSWDEFAAAFDYWNRIADPGLGQFTTADPTGFDAGDSNLRRLMGNNLVKNVDPTGLVLVAFDGTGNNKDKKAFGAPTNVAKIYDAYLSKHKLYVDGIGTDSWTNIWNIFKQGTGYGWAERVKRAVDWVDCLFKEHPNADDKQLDVVGFSRGAGQAMDFTHRVQDVIKKHGVTIRFVGVFDTVAAIGGEKLNAGDKQLDVLPGLKVYHAIAGYERREKFTVHTLAGATKEVWFPGVHSDIGGGYDNTALSDIALSWMTKNANTVTPLIPWIKVDLAKINPLYFGHESWATPAMIATSKYDPREMPRDAVVHSSYVVNWLYNSEETRGSLPANPITGWSEFRKEQVNDDDDFLQSFREWKRELYLDRWLKSQEPKSK